MGVNLRWIVEKTELGIPMKIHSRICEGEKFVVSKPEILIVEDDAVFRQAMKKILISRFPTLSISYASNDVETFERLKNNGPDLIIMDIELPGKNGLVLTKKIKAIYPEMIIIILTNHDLTEYREVAFQNGANYFLSKETTKTSEILALIGSILASKTTAIHSTM
jgi:DNA-binding NarL/FixJ family response regulator